MPPNVLLRQKVNAKSTVQTGGHTSLWNGPRCQPADDLVWKWNLKQTRSLAKKRKPSNECIHGTTCMTWEVAMFKRRKEMQILSAGEYPLNVLMFMRLFIRMVHGGPSRALICYPLTKKKSWVMVISRVTSVTADKPNSVVLLPPV